MKIINIEYIKLINIKYKTKLNIRKNNIRYCECLNYCIKNHLK